ncbi:MAG: phage head closure protein [Pseudomonadota bacterium]
MGAGKLRERITIQRNAPGAEDTFGAATDGWADFYTCWAQRVDLSDSEREVVDQVQASLMVRFTVRACTESRSITPKDRINHDGLTWQIHGVKPAAKNRQAYIEIRASAGTDG